MAQAPEAAAEGILELEGALADALETVQGLEIAREFADRDLLLDGSRNLCRAHKGDPRLGGGWA